jgi:ribonuclease HI
MYSIYSDGASRGNPGPAGAGAVILDKSGKTVHEVAESLGITTNNVAEYQALLEALRYCVAKGLKPVAVYADSQLLIRQLQGVYRVKHEQLIPLHAEAKHLLELLGCLSLQHIPREENKAADRLANKGLEKGL